MRQMGLQLKLQYFILYCAMLLPNFCSTSSHLGGKGKYREAAQVSLMCPKVILKKAINPVTRCILLKQNHNCLKKNKLINKKNKAINKQIHLEVKTLDT